MFPILPKFLDTRVVEGLWPRDLLDPGSQCDLFRLVVGHPFPIVWPDVWIQDCRSFLGRESFENSAGAVDNQDRGLPTTRARRARKRAHGVSVLMWNAQ